MSWAEFSDFINGLSGDSPLGRIVSIRAEKDPEVIRKFTPEEKRIRTEYLAKVAKTKSEKEVDDVLGNMLKAFKNMAK